METPNFRHDFEKSMTSHTGLIRHKSSLLEEAIRFLLCVLYYLIKKGIKP